MRDWIMHLDLITKKVTEVTCILKIRQNLINGKFDYFLEVASF